MKNVWIPCCWKRRKRKRSPLFCSKNEQNVDFPLFLKKFAVRAERMQFSRGKLGEFSGGKLGELSILVISVDLRNIDRCAWRNAGGDLWRSLPRASSSWMFACTAYTKSENYQRLNLFFNLMNSLRTSVVKFRKLLNKFLKNENRPLPSPSHRRYTRVPRRTAFACRFPCN